MQFARPCIVFSVSLFLLAGCGKPSAPEQTHVLPIPLPVQAPPAPAVEVPIASDITSFYQTALWRAVKDGSHWTDATIGEIRSEFSSLNQARDIELFCPGYASSSRLEQENCWLILISAVAKLESGFNPHSRFREPNGVWSIGILQLSPRECRNAPTAKALTEPIKNLECGITMMAQLVAHDGCISGPSSGRGAGRYWSVLRPPYRTKSYHVGKRAQIISYTRHFRDRI